MQLSMKSKLRLSHKYSFKNFSEIEVLKKNVTIYDESN